MVKKYEQKRVNNARKQREKFYSKRINSVGNFYTNKLKEEKYIGYFKYSGQSIRYGLFDAKKAAEALFGFDEILRYFLIKEDPNLYDVKFDIPVRIRGGSWEISIPETITQIISPNSALYAALATYATFAAKKAAEEGLFQTGPAKDIKTTLRAAIKSVQWMIKIGSHIGSLNKNKLNNPKIDLKKNEITIDNQNKKLVIPKKYFDLFNTFPTNLFSRNTYIIQKDIYLEVGVYENGKEEKVKITEKQKSIFCTENDVDEGIILPELKHNEHVELEGIITRGNEKHNTIGFEYKKHVLACKPENGDIVAFKNRIVSPEENHIFPAVKIIGVVDRTDKFGGFKEKRPMIIFSDIIVIKEKNKNQKLF